MTLLNTGSGGQCNSEPRLDADLYIPALLEGFLGSERWMAAQIGKIGGMASAEAKAAAARFSYQLLER